MLITVITVVLTSNLAIGVVVGVLAAPVLFVRRVAHFVTFEGLNGQATPFHANLTGNLGAGH